MGRRRFTMDGCTKVYNGWVDEGLRWMGVRRFTMDG